MFPLLTDGRRQIGDGDGLWIVAMLRIKVFGRMQNLFGAGRRLGVNPMDRLPALVPRGCQSENHSLEIREDEGLAKDRWRLAVGFTAGQRQHPAHDVESCVE